MYCYLNNYYYLYSVIKIENCRTIPITVYKQRIREVNKFLLIFI